MYTFAVKFEKLSRFHSTTQVQFVFDKWYQLCMLTIYLHEYRRIQTQFGIQCLYYIGILSHKVGIFKTNGILDVRKALV